MLKRVRRFDMSRKIRMVITFAIAIAMILNVNLSFANRQSGSIHLFKDGEMNEGNNPMYEQREDVYVRVNNFVPGEYDVVVKTPGGNGIILGSGVILVPESGSMLFNLFEETTFDFTDSKSGVYTVIVGDNKLKNFRLIEKSDPVDPVDPNEPTEQEKLVDRLIKEEGFIPIANGVELNKIRNNYSEGELFGEGTKWEGTYITIGLKDNYVLVKDIDLWDFSNWIPIGNTINRFEGTLEGNDYPIRNLTIDHSSTDYIGLFGYINEGEVRNLSLIDPVVEGNYYVGSITGFSFYSTLSNISILIEDNINSSVRARSYVGSMVGYGVGVKVENSRNEVTVEGFSHVGGIIGQHNGTKDKSFSGVYNTTNSGNVKGNTKVGGITGDNGSIIFKSSNYGYVELSDFSRITGTYSEFGGIAGHSGGGIENSINYGNVIIADGISAFNEVGGIVGRSNANNTIINSRNYGSVRGTGRVGGIAGYNTAATFGGDSGYISEVLNFGTVNGTSNVGGIIGFNIGSFVKAYNEGTISGLSAVGGIAGSSNARQYYNVVAMKEVANTGSVTGTIRVGGIVGILVNDTIEDSYNLGEINGGSLVGGIIGDGNSGTLTRLYSSGTVIGVLNQDALVGSDGNMTVTDVYYNLEISGTSSILQAYDLFNDEMVLQESFNNFFNDGKWMIIVNSSYPFLSWHINYFIPYVN